MAASPPPSPPSLLADLDPPSLARAWSSAPHPTLPIVATATEEKTVNVYSLTSFKLLSTITGGHKRSVRQAAWKPNLSKGESVLATASFDSTVGIWKHEDGYSNPEGGRLAIAEQDGSMETDMSNNAEEDPEEWNFSVQLTGHDSEVKSLSWSASGTLLATSSRDKSVWIWEEVSDDNDYETVAVLTDHSGDVKCVLWHPSEEMVASCSYDDTVRLWREDIDDWTCVAVMLGHGGTVWGLAWEGENKGALLPGSMTTGGEDEERWRKSMEKSGPRLASCSDDLTVRIWRRKPNENNGNNSNAPMANRLPSILRTSSIEETWLEESVLPITHERSIYSVAWSTNTGLIASCGGDGRIVIYREKIDAADVNGSTEPQTNGDVPLSTTSEANAEGIRTRWEIYTTIEDAHGVQEINHVTWARRADRDKSYDGEEVLLSTGDDGAVKVWSVPAPRT